MMAVTMGHNGGPDISEADDFKMKFVRFNINDVLKTLREMTLEVGGFYMRVLLVMYDRGGYLPADDNKAAMAVGLPLRTYRRMKDELLEQRRIREAEMGYTQSRVIREIELYAAEAMRRREAAREREEKKRVASTNRQIDAEKQPKNAVQFQVSSELSQRNSFNSSDKNANEINECSATAVPQPCHEAGTSLSLSLSLEEREKTLLSDIEQEETVSETGVSDTAKGKRKRHDYPLDFLVFWADYPRTDGTSKLDAAKAWAKLTPEEKRLATARLPAFREYEERRMKRSPGATGVHAATYLNGKRWETLGEVKGPGTRYWWENPEKRATVTLDQWEALVRKWANGSWPVEKLGYPPKSANHVIPEEVIERMDLLRLYDVLGNLIEGQRPAWSQEVH